MQARQIEDCINLTKMAIKIYTIRKKIRGMK